jgi:nitronate monooxygenase
VKIPVIASGGMADARSLVAALALGAEGVNMGTRFMATQEADIHHNVKEQIVKNTERDTILTNRTLRNTSRVARNAIAEEVVRIQQDPTKTIDDVRELVSGARGRSNVLKGGDIDGGIWSAGQSQGLIHDIPTCKELVARISQEAEQIIRARLDRMAGTLIAAE